MSRSVEALTVAIDDKEGTSSQVASLDEYRSRHTSTTRSDRAFQRLLEPLREELHALPPGSVIGDHHVILDFVARGGMGVIYKARDRILGRRVALKLHRSRIAGENSSAQDRFIREARTLASITHQNVVAVYEHGFHQGSPWISMEYVDGVTLSKWAKGREWREILTVLLEVARGIAAVHDKGIIHRDIKPHNVMVDDDRRVRILDFGLALGLRPTSFSDSGAAFAPGDVEEADLDVLIDPRLTQAGEVPGTIGYIAPERKMGRDASFASDQFAWSVMAHELLLGWRPETQRAAGIEMQLKRIRSPQRARRVPAWLRRVVQRGFDEDPEKRWSSMHVLIAELESGQTRMVVRQGMMLLLLLATVLVAGDVIARVIDSRQASEHQTRTREMCSHAGAEILEVWNDDVRGFVAESIAATGASFQRSTWERVNRAIDLQVDEWRQARVDTCLALNNIIGPPMKEHEHQRSTWCLSERQLELVALVQQLGRADDRSVAMFVQAAASLRPVALCKNREYLSRMPLPPQGLAQQRLTQVQLGFWRVHALASTGEYSVGVALAYDNVVDAESLGWSPMLAAARVQLGTLLARNGKQREAENMLREAYRLAAETDAYEVAAEAGMQIFGILIEDPLRQREALDWWMHADVSISKLGVAKGVLGIEQRHEWARVLALKGELVQAETDLEAGLSAQKRLLDPEHPFVPMTRLRLAEVHRIADNHATARAHYKEAMPALEAAFGSDHPEVARALSELARTEEALDNLAGAMSLVQREHSILTDAFGAGHAATRDSARELTRLHLKFGKNAVASLP